MTWMVATLRRVPQSLAVVLAVTAAGACSERPVPAETAPATDAAEGGHGVEQTRFAQVLDVDMEAMTSPAEGIYVRDRRQGRGAVAETGRRVTIQYRAWLPDGTLFEERPSPEGFGASEFVLGENAPVEGLNTALVGMRAGGERLVVLAPERGYGLVGRPAGVPAGSPLVFEVTLLRVTD